MQVAEDADVDRRRRDLRHQRAGDRRPRPTTPPASSRSTTSRARRGSRCADEVPCGRVARRCSRTTASPPSRPASRRTSGPRSPRSPPARPTRASSTRRDAVAAGDDVDHLRDPGRRGAADDVLHRDAGADRGRRPRRRSGSTWCLRRGPGRSLTGRRLRQRREPAARDPLGRPPALLLVPAALAAAAPASSRWWRWSRATAWRGLPEPARLRGRSGRRCGSRCSPRRSRCWSASCSGCRWPGCSPGSTSAAAALLRALVTVPLVLPPVVAGVALLTAFGRTGVIGEPLLDADRLRLPVHDLRRGARAHRSSRMPFWCSRRGRAALRRRGVRRRRGHPRRRPAGRRSAGSRCRSRCPGSSPAWCWPGPARSASSARPSPSPATTPAPPRRCRR